MPAEPDPNIDQNGNTPFNDNKPTSLKYTAFGAPFAGSIFNSSYTTILPPTNKQKVVFMVIG